MTTKILGLIDFEKVETLLEGFNKTTGFVAAILDLKGNVLSKSGWQPICTEFHRVNPETSKKCTISDTVLAGKMEEGEKYHFYQCLNGLVDVAVPIVIKGIHIANLFLGQFFFEEPDRYFFKKQAEKYEFNENIYLKALGKVPVVSKEKVLAAMDFLLNMTQMISDMTFQKLEQMELNEAIQKNERILRLFVEHSPASIAMFDNHMRYLVASHRFLLDYNLGNQNVIGRSHYEVFPDISERWKEIHRRCLAGETISESNDAFPRADGTTHWVRWEIRPWYEPETHIGGIILFSEVITAQGEAENELRNSEAKFRAVAELSPMAIYSSTGSDQRAVYINPTFYIIFGFTREDVPTVGHWWIKAFPDEIYRQQVIDQWVYNIEQANKNNTDVEALECVCTCKDGSKKVIAWVGKTVGNEFWAFGYDVTERKHTEEEIKKQLDELRRWHQITLNREGRVMELKQEVNELLKQLGKPIAYHSAEQG